MVKYFCLGFFGALLVMSTNVAAIPNDKISPMNNPLCDMLSYSKAACEVQRPFCCWAGNDYNGICYDGYRFGGPSACEDDVEDESYSRQ